MRPRPNILAFLVATCAVTLFGAVAVFGSPQDLKPQARTIDASARLFATDESVCRRVGQAWVAGEMLPTGFSSFSNQIHALRAQVRAARAAGSLLVASRLRQELFVLRERNALETAACAGGPEASVEGKATKFTISSPAFSNNGDIPIESSCWVNGPEDPGEGLSLPLNWKNVPRSATHLALLVYDSDADFIHWFILVSKKSEYWTGLPLDVPDEKLEDIKGIYQEPNDFGVAGYSGPCPPAGERHKYTFELYAVRGAKEKDYGETAAQIRKKLRRIQLNKTAITAYFTGIEGPSPTPTLTPQPSATPSATNTPAPTPTATRTPTSTATPTPTILLNVSSISLGEVHSCALLTSGAAKCWGSDEYGQVGYGGEYTPLYRPTSVFGLNAGVAQIAAASYHTCALLVSGGVKCWGFNLMGSVGDGTSGNYRLTPQAVIGLSAGVTQIAAGGAHSCARLANGALKCWGNNSSGQIGIGSADLDTTTPQAVVGLSSNVSEVSAGLHHTCALLSSGAVKCWGANFAGQIGDGSSNPYGDADRNTPTQVTGLDSGVIQIAAGGGHTCALLASGAVKCWGLNNSGQLGDGTFQPKSSPISVAGLTSGVSQISAGNSHTCALLASGGVKCWGRGADGQLGGGSAADKNTPTAVSGLSSGVAQISAGSRHTCARLSSGAAKCWGFGFYGQIGEGTSSSWDVPVFVRNES